MKSMKIADSLSVVSGRPATTSLEVARFFGKRHDNVIRDIQEIITQLPENFLQLNFEEYGICRVCNVPSLNDLPASGIRNALAAAWGIVNRGYTDVRL